MNLRTSAGWQRLFLVVLIMLGPLGLATLGFAIVNIQGFMHSGWAVWILAACILVLYSIAYVTDVIRRREARGSDMDGDSSPLIFADGSKVAEPGPQPVSSGRNGVSTTTWIWIGLTAVVGYGIVRFAWDMANGVSVDWTVVVALVVVACAAAIMPSAIAWQRFLRSVASIGDLRAAWPVFRTDQFAEQLHRSRPGAIIPQDLVLIADASHLSVWTAEREPRRLVSLPLDGSVTVRSAVLSDRLGKAGVRVQRTVAGETDAFELVSRRKGVFTYFNAGLDTAQRCVDDIERARH